MNLKTTLSGLPGFGPVYISRLEKLFITNVGDLVRHFPFRYEDLSNVKKIAELSDGEIATVRGQVWETQTIRTRAGKFLTKALVNDGSGSVDVVWFNQPYLTKSIKIGVSISLAGKVNLYKSKMTFTAPDFELGDSQNHTGRIIPVYPETAGLSSKWLRHKLSLILPQVLTNLTEYLPTEILIRHNLVGLGDALQKIHRPESETDILLARKRLGFEELFLLNLAAELRKKDRSGSVAQSFKIDRKKLDLFVKSLPFTLTSSQINALSEITSDLSQSKPMNRLLLGDVGSGKTVIAAAASYIAFLNGYRTAFMAPTEILALQHAKTLKQFLAPHGLNITSWTGSTKEGEGDLYIGTQALLHKKEAVTNLGLVIVDEQHRFGVTQRAALRKSGGAPHLLSMSATPIPRTLALTLYGDLDISIMDETPPGRVIVKTYLTSKEKRNQAYAFIKEKIEQGRQAFIITPLIDPSETGLSLKSAKTEWARLKEEVWPDLNIGLLHGQLKPREKEAVLNDFRTGKYQILVSTPVVEVGIDIPNATVMVIEGAERFGLAQLHQLRGRIGRGLEESWCLLFTEDEQPETLKRLSALQKYHSGPKLAELDLKLRGPGEVYGLRQSGVPDLKIADLTDTALLKESKQAAEKYLEGGQTLNPALMGVLNTRLIVDSAPD